MTNDDDLDVIELLQKKIVEAEQRLARLRAALAACSSNGTSSSWKEVAIAVATTPPITDICNYLRERGGVVHQNDIIRAVGEVRRLRYPSLTNHYSPIWRALEFHVRRGLLIACVNEQGEPTELKGLKARPKGLKIRNVPELYERDNWFVLRPAEEDLERLSSARPFG